MVNWQTRPADPHLGGESFDYDQSTPSGVPDPVIVTVAEFNAQLAAQAARNFGMALICGRL